MTRTNIKNYSIAPADNLHSRILKYQRMKTNFTNNLKTLRRHIPGISTTMVSIAHSRTNLKTINSEKHHQSFKAIKYSKLPKIMKLEDKSDFIQNKYFKNVSKSVSKRKVKINPHLLQQLNFDISQNDKQKVVQKMDIIQPRLRRSKNKNVLYHFINNYQMFTEDK
mmetsp:Transcript_6811/g.5959  ORF Transcript_6811/g.5959 Transcript_6811/m.5959 type:complete len:166 (+) Transcript_6811:537-1034(+)